MFVRPESVIKDLAITAGMKVADIGAGVGSVSVFLGKAVGSSGRVYAIEVQQNLLSRIQDAARRAGVRNIETVWGDVDEKNGTTLKSESVDLALAMNTLFQLEKKEQFAEEVVRILKPRGFFAVVDWTDSFGGMGPTQEQVITKADTRALFEKAGLTYVRDLRSHPHHFGILLRKPG